MAEQRSPIIEFPRGRYSGRRMRDPPKGEAGYFYRCPVCGGWVDCRDLGQVFDHDGPLPHPTEDWRRQSLMRASASQRSVTHGWFRPHGSALLYLWPELVRNFRETAPISWSTSLVLTIIMMVVAAYWADAVAKPSEKITLR